MVTNVISIAQTIMVNHRVCFMVLVMKPIIFVQQDMNLRCVIAMDEGMLVEWEVGFLMPNPPALLATKHHNSLS